MDILGNIVKGVSDFASGIGKGFTEAIGGLGPIGTIGLAVAAPYLISYLAASSPALAAAGTTAATTATGAAVATEGALAGTTAESLFSSAALGEASASYAAGTSLTESLGSLAVSSDMGLALAEAAPYEFGALSSSEFLANATTSELLSAESSGYGLDAMGLNDSSQLYASQSLGEAGAGKSIDTSKAVDKALSLLGGKGQMPQLPNPEDGVPALKDNSIQGLKSAGQGGGSGLSKYVEQATPELVSGVRKQEELYKSLLARGY